ncbi:MAG: hypothetical protein IPI42_16350 [Saprospiraceae bacterium]|nr:hypothetical protein [Candidatus Parvibacillus calidus]
MPKLGTVVINQIEIHPTSSNMENAGRTLYKDIPVTSRVAIRAGKDLDNPVLMNLLRGTTEAWLRLF